MGIGWNERNVYFIIWAFKGYTMLTVSLVDDCQGSIFHFKSPPRYSRSQFTKLTTANSSIYRRYRLRHALKVILYFLPLFSSLRCVCTEACTVIDILTWYCKLWVQHFITWYIAVFTNGNHRSKVIYERTKANIDEEGLPSFTNLYIILATVPYPRDHLKIY